jgi:hypothetical protein
MISANIEQTKNLENNTQATEILHAVYRLRDGYYFRSDIFWQENDKPGVLRVSISNPEGSYEARRFPNESKFELMSITNNPRDAQMHSLVQKRIYALPYSVFDAVSNFFHASNDFPQNWNFVDIRTINEGNDNLAIAELKHSNGATMQIVFYKDYHWAVKEYKYEAVDSAGAGKRTYRFENGIPIIQSSEDISFDIQNGRSRVIDRAICTVDAISLSPPPLDEFDPEKVLGIKIGGTGANWTMRLILLGIGLVLIAAWFYSKRKEAGKVKG